MPKIGVPNLFSKLKDRKTPQANFFLNIMSNICCRGTGKEGKTKELVEDREVKQVVCEELCVTQSYVKDGVRQSVTKLCVKDGV